MTTTTMHWTERSIDDFLYKIAADFVDQLQLAMASMPLSQTELAKHLGITRGRVSQIFNNPGNLTLKQIIRYARALNLKVSIVAYDDKDSEHERGPINSDIFRLCWENAGSPDNFRQLSAANAVTVGLAHDELPFDWAYNNNGRYINTGRVGTASGTLARGIVRSSVLPDSALTDIQHVA